MEKCLLNNYQIETISVGDILEYVKEDGYLPVGALVKVTGFDEYAECSRILTVVTLDEYQREYGPIKQLLEKGKTEVLLSMNFLIHTTRIVSRLELIEL